MRIEALLPEQLTAALVASQVNYLEITGLKHVGRDQDLRQGSDAMRFWRENGWRLKDATEILRLINFSGNKLQILQLLRRNDWLRIMELMPKEELLRGLRFFSREKLLRLIYWLPKEFQLKILLRVLGLHDLVGKMRMPEILEMLRSERLPMPLLAKRLAQFMDKKFLQELLGFISEGNVSHLNEKEMQPMFARLKKGQLLEAMKRLPYKAIHPFMEDVLKLDMQLLMRLPEPFINRAYARMSMAELLLGAEILPKEIILTMLTQLPDDYLVCVPEMAEEGLLLGVLLSDYSDVILALGQQLEQTLVAA